MPQCKTANCPHPGEPCFTELNETGPDVYFCAEHKITHHYCIECGLKLTLDEISAKEPLCQLCLTLVKQDMSEDDFINLMKEADHAAH